MKFEIIMMIIVSRIIKKWWQILVTPGVGECVNWILLDFIVLSINVLHEGDDE